MGEENKACDCKPDLTNWLKVFTANYEGTSKEAQSLQPFLKETYKGNVYIPWAVIEKLTYMCDPAAKFTTILNDNGGLVHSDIIENYSYNMQKGEVISETKTYMMSHTIKMALEFLGKVMVDEYPIQDTAYNAPKVLDQNLVNKAIQRCKARLASRCTGLGLKLYEGHDLQFDEPLKTEPPTLTIDDKPTIKEPAAEVKTKAKAKPVKVEEEPKIELVHATESVGNNTIKAEEDLPEALQSKDVSNVEWSGEVQEFIDFIRETDKAIITRALEQLNVALIKKYHWALSTADTDEELADKISKFSNIAKVKQSLVNMIKV